MQENEDFSAKNVRITSRRNRRNSRHDMPQINKARISTAGKQLKMADRIRLQGTNTPQELHPHRGRSGRGGSLTLRLA